MNRVAVLEIEGNQVELDQIRASAPDAIPDARMRTLWSLLLNGRAKRVHEDRDLHGWRRRFELEGLTTALRLEFREMLTPRVSLREPFRWPFGDEENEEPERIRQLVDWDIVLSSRHVHATLRDRDENERWAEALPALLPDLTSLLRDVLDLMRDLGGATERSDLSYSSQRSISHHPQNTGFRDWTALVELNRDAWLATAARSPEQARAAAQTWSQIPYPLFRRLAFFAAAQDGIVPCAQALEWLLGDDEWWLWSIETQRETLRLVVALAPRLDEGERARLEQAILAGPPREMYRDDIEEERWTGIRDRDIWMRLAKMSQAGADLNAAPRERLEWLTARYPLGAFRQSARGVSNLDGCELRVHVPAPRDQEELIEWLRENPEPDDWRRDDWRERCRDDFEVAARALTALADEGTWPNGRWREALQQWSEDDLTERSWRGMAPVLDNVPLGTLQELAHGVSGWLEKLARTFEGQEGTFLSLCDRVLGLEYEIDDEPGDDLVGDAINHPVGNVAEALLRWWYRSNLEDGQGPPAKQGRGSPGSATRGCRSSAMAVYCSQLT